VFADRGEERVAGAVEPQLLALLAALKVGQPATRFLLELRPRIILAAVTCRREGGPILQSRGLDRSLASWRARTASAKSLRRAA
jgi:hypothetical protein